MTDLFLSPLIKLAIDKAANPLIQQFCQMWGMKKNRDKLHRYLMAVQEKIANAEEHAVDGSAEQAWMKELQAAAYEAVDVLDEFQYEALRREAIRQQPSSSAKALKSFFSHENALLFRRKINNKMTKVLDKIDEIINEMKKFELVQRDLPPTINRETSSFIIESEIIGREDESEKIVNVLLDPQREKEKEKVSVLPIVGMGGLGKTTLAQLVYERVKGHFQLSLWVCVSTKFEINDIMRSIIQVAKKETDISISKKEVLQQKLREILERKKYLLVLDDVWNEEREKWNELKDLLSSGAGAGSVILVTTRIKAVAEIMGTFGYCIDLAFLTEEDSWALFEKRAFGAGVRDQSKEQIGRIIVRKCGGLPLAVKAMGGMMRTMSDVRDWTAVAQNEIWKGLEASSENDILPILKLSYDYLPPHTKQCFAFCAVFPQDYLIDVDKLIQLWMANDLIPTDSIMDLERKGRYIFEELRSRSFFQNVTEEINTYPDNQIVITCNMHDLMHDLATRVAGEKCFTLLEANDPRITQKEVQNLFVSGDQLLEIKINVQFPNVRTLLVNDPIEKYPYLSKSSSLRAMQLQLSGLVSLPKELGYMRHLRYLNLSKNYAIRILPESITKLYNLQTLNLSHTTIRELPKGMRYMTNLRHLFLNGCRDLERMPAGLGQLKFLQTLTKYIVDPDRGVGIGELKNLNLCGHLSISGLEKVRDGVDAGAKNLSSKSGLSSLELRWSSLKETRKNDEAALEALRPHSNLKFLKIVSYGGTCFSEWMKEYSIMKNLKKLRLNECCNCAELPLFWQLPLLEKLCLKEMESLISIVSGACKDADGSKLLVEFPHLKILKIKNLQNLEGWHERDCELVQFPNLKDLSIENCPKLKTIPSVWQLPLLEKLCLKEMESLISIVSGACKDADGSKLLVEFPHLKILKIKNLQNLEGWHERYCELVQFPNLKDLSIENCPKLKTIPSVWQLPLLEKLCLKEMESLISIVSGACKDADGSKLLVEFPHLKILKIKNLQNLEGWHERYCELVQFPNLKDLSIENCPKLKTIPSVWQLPLLEKLCLKEMESLISIVSGACKDADGSKLLVEFPHLKILDMYELPNLEGWNERDCELVQFPKLEGDLSIKNCPKLKTLPTHAPLLAKLRIENSGEIKLRQISNLPMLSILDIRVDTPPDQVDAFRPPKTLQTMLIQGFENVNPLEEKEGEEEQNWEANSLRKLSIYNSQCFFSWGRTRSALGFWKHFAALKSLAICCCNGLVYWPEEEFRNLRCLKRLWIDNCASFTGLLAASSSPTPRGGDSLPQLESLRIWVCPELVQLPGGSMPLEALEILRCPKLSREGLAGFTNLTKLMQLGLYGFPNWRALPDNMWHLPSLEQLEIWDCPGIESLPESLQQRLPSLQNLEIGNCPELVKHFWRGGNYRDLASAIPDKRIRPEEEDEEITRSGTIFRRLLLKCRRS